MGLIKEPAGVDFVINSRPLTKEEESAISAYIAAYKSKNKTDKKSKSKPKSKRTSKVAQ
jgi:hypothetical protein